MVSLSHEVLLQGPSCQMHMAPLWRAAPDIIDNAHSTLLLARLGVARGSLSLQHLGPSFA